MWWGRRTARLVERGVDDELVLVRHQMAEDAMGLLGRWRELDRLDAEIERRRDELEALRRERQRLTGTE